MTPGAWCVPGSSTDNQGCLAAPPAPGRYDITPHPPDGFVDINDIIAVAALFGQSCAP